MSQSESLLKSVLYAFCVFYFVYLTFVAIFPLFRLAFDQFARSVSECWDHYAQMNSNSLGAGSIIL